MPRWSRRSCSARCPLTLCVSRSRPGFCLQPMRTMGPLGSSLLLVAWMMLGPTFSRSQELSFEPRADAFVRNADNYLCDEYWTSWPAVQERAIADGTVMVWHMGTSVGNLMRTLMYILPV
ncbi:unnamed protein product, partial [Ectocarpus sp. 13 AM-2016]